MSLYRRFRRRSYALLNPEEDDRIGRFIDTFIIILISLSILAVILESDKSLHKAYASPFLLFEWFSSITFTVEYVLRVWTCVEDERFAKPISGRIRYMLTPMALVDLVAILPFYLPMFFSFDARVLRAIRLFRLFRLFKIGRYSASLNSLIGVFNRKKEELAITFFAMVILLIMASSVIFFVENVKQPEKFSSIPAAMWWGVATLTTVGYGDVYPMTPLGKFLGALIALLGVGIVALPAGIIASGFNEAIQEQKERKEQKRKEKIQALEEANAQLEKQLEQVHSCPHCGGHLALTEHGLEPADDPSHGH